MKIIYCHHALRDKGNPPSQNDGLLPLGIEDAKVQSKILQGAKKICKIYSSTYFRCVETANLLNENLKVDIIKDERLNEFIGVHKAVEGIKDISKHETWKDAQIRIIECLKDIVYSHDANDIVVCVTSGVNITAFICLAFGIEPSNDLPFPLVPSCSLVGFDIDKTHFEKINL